MKQYRVLVDPIWRHKLLADKLAVRFGRAPSRHLQEPGPIHKGQLLQGCDIGFKILAALLRGCSVAGADGDQALDLVREEGEGVVGEHIVDVGVTRLLQLCADITLQHQHVIILPLFNIIRPISLTRNATHPSGVLKQRLEAGGACRNQVLEVGLEFQDLFAELDLVDLEVVELVGGALRRRRESISLESIWDGWNCSSCSPCGGGSICRAIGSLRLLPCLDFTYLQSSSSVGSIPLLLKVPHNLRGLIASVIHLP